MNYFDLIKEHGVGPKIGKETKLASGSTVIPVKIQMALAPNGVTMEPFLKLYDGRNISVKRLIDSESVFRLNDQSRILSMEDILSIPVHFFGLRWRVQIVSSRLVYTPGYNPGVIDTYLFTRT